MIITLIGIIHFSHAPILLFVFVRNYVSDIIYMNYFFGIMFLYTFLNGECPISYICKKMINATYVAGENISHYPEMTFIPEPYIHYYFGITTTMYLLSLVNAVRRTKTYDVMAVLFIYFLFMHNQKCWAFFYFQEFTKWVLFFYFSRYII